MHRTTIPSWSSLLRQGALSRRRCLRAAAGTVGVLVLVGAGLLWPIRAWADPPIHTKSAILDFATQMIVEPGFTELTRTEDGVSVHIHATDLNAGHAYTFWIVEIQPDGFAHGGRVAGKVVNKSGVANIMVEAEVGEELGDFHLPMTPIQEGDLMDPLDSTFLLVIRDHGPASSDPDELHDQLFTHQTGVPGVTDYGISIHAP